MKKMRDFCEAHNVGITLTIWVLLGIAVAFAM
ncbi:MAG: hypothetical protein Athens071416_206 [Parcubacteria group bacterium Athens0714_16]|nr:MAG: hypothetical protein Athens071416_206 [Parcubacteria group bacterium Athens0714_16]